MMGRPPRIAEPEMLGLGGGEVYSGLFGPFAGFAAAARVENGYPTLPDRPGIGFEGLTGLYGILRRLIDGG